MYISEIQKRLMENIGQKGTDTYNRALGLALYNGARPDEMSDAYHLALWFEGAPKSVKQEFVDSFVLDHADNLRVCTHCGRFMHEGYLLETQYACSDDCAIAIYEGDEAQLREDIRASVDDDEGDFFWTEW